MLFFVYKIFLDGGRSDKYIIFQKICKIFERKIPEPKLTIRIILYKNICIEGAGGQTPPAHALIKFALIFWMVNGEK